MYFLVVIVAYDEGGVTYSFHREECPRVSLKHGDEEELISFLWTNQKQFGIKGATKDR